MFADESPWVALVAEFDVGRAMFTVVDIDSTLDAGSVGPADMRSGVATKRLPWVAVVTGHQFVKISMLAHPRLLLTVVARSVSPVVDASCGWKYGYVGGVEVGEVIIEWSEKFRVERGRRDWLSELIDEGCEVGFHTRRPELSYSAFGM